MWFEWLMVAVGLVLTVGTGFFVASEFALVNLDRNDLEGRERAGEARLGPTIRALRITSTHLFGCSAGDHIDHLVDRLHLRARGQPAARGSAGRGGGGGRRGSSGWCGRGDRPRHVVVDGDR